MTAEELEFRMGGIGGSDAPAVMEKSPWMTPLMLWELKTRRRFPDPPNFQMLQGLRLEPVARRAYEEKYEIEMPADRTKHKSLDFVRVHMDGVNWELGRALEIKCPGKVDHAEAVKGLIPLKYWYQCVHICAAADLEELDYFSYYRDRTTGTVDTATVLFKRSRVPEKKLLDKEARFWDLVLKDKRPDEKESKTSDIFKVRKNNVPAPRKTKPIITEVTHPVVQGVARSRSIEEAMELLTKAKALGAKVKIHIQFDLNIEG